MARRLRRGHAEREALLTSAVEAGSREPRRIAADLHDGAVQDLAGVASDLADLPGELVSRVEAREPSRSRPQRVSRRRA